MVDRYVIENAFTSGYKDPEGEWVDYDDYATLESKGAVQAELIDSLQASLAESEARVAGLLEDMKYIIGIVERGTGKELIGNVPIRKQLLEYVKKLEAENKRLRELISSLVFAHDNPSVHVSTPDSEMSVWEMARRVAGGAE